MYWSRSAQWRKRTNGIESNFKLFTFPMQAGYKWRQMRELLCNGSAASLLSKWLNSLLYDRFRLPLILPANWIWEEWEWLIWGGREAESTNYCSHSCQKKHFRVFLGRRCFCSCTKAEAAAGEYYIQRKGFFNSLTSSFQTSDRYAKWEK